MTHEVAIICPDATLQEAAQQMQASIIGTLPVCDGDRVVDIIKEGAQAVNGKKLAERSM
jgi:CBS domain-containing protein